MHMCCHIIINIALVQWSPKGLYNSYLLVDETKCFDSKFCGKMCILYTEKYSSHGELFGLIILLVIKSQTKQVSCWLQIISTGVCKLWPEGSEFQLKIDGIFLKVQILQRYIKSLLLKLIVYSEYQLMFWAHCQLVAYC